MTYPEQLLDRRWLNKRTEILLRDNWKCQHPGCEQKYENLEVHHLDYITGAMAWEHPNSMLLTLCDRHHKLEYKETRNKVEAQLINTLKMKGFLLSDLLSLSCKIDTDIEFTETLLNVLRTNG